MNHRSAPRLIDLQRKMHALLNESNCIICVSDKWNSDAGVVSLLIAEDEEIEAKKIAENISDRILSGIAPNNLCILCKQKPQDYTQKIIVKLNNRQVSIRIENDYQDLIKEPIVEVLVALLYLAVDRKHPYY